jgi:hypothetical protein
MRVPVRERSPWWIPLYLFLAVPWMSGTAGAETSTAPEPAPGKSDLEISVTDGLLSVRLSNAEILPVMEELSRKTGMRIKLDQGASKRISLTFSRMPFDKGIRNLVRPLNYAMIWKKGKDPDGKDVEVLEEIHIFREGHQGGATVDLRPAPAPETPAGRVTKRQWDEETRRKMLEKMRVTPSEP